MLSDQTGASLHLNPADAFGFAFSPLHGGDRFEPGVAVGTSLLVIAINSAAALLARIGTHVQVDWPLVAAFIVAAVVARWSATGSPLSFAPRCWHAPSPSCWSSWPSMRPLGACRASSERLSPYVCSCEQAVRPGSARRAGRPVPPHRC